MNERELLFLRKLMGLSRDDLARLLGCSDQRGLSTGLSTDFPTERGIIQPSYDAMEPRSFH